MVNSYSMLAMRQKLLDHAKQSEPEVFKTASKRAIHKTKNSRSNWRTDW